MEQLGDRIGVWVAAICALGIFSFLYRENRIYRFFEHVFMGVAGGWTIASMWSDVLRPQWFDPMVAGFKALLGWPGYTHPWQALWVVAILLGAAWYCQGSVRYGWIARMVIALFLGAGAGLVFREQFGANWPQVLASFKPLTSVNNVIYVLTVVCVMIYFFFSVERTNPVINYGSRLGRWLLMIAFGAFFGSTVMARMSLLIERLQFLFGDWLGLGR